MEKNQVESVLTQKLRGRNLANLEDMGCNNVVLKLEPLMG
jgi:hypothetical protein